MALFACKVGGTEGISVKTDTITGSVNQTTFTIPNTRQLLGVTSVSVVLSGGFWNNPRVTVDMNNNTITMGGGGSTVDTKRTFTVGYSYIDT